MKHLKRFNENIGDSKYTTWNAHSKCVKFYNKYKSIVDFDESEYKQGDEPTNSDLLSEIGGLCNKLNMTKEDVKFVLDNFDCSFDGNKLLQSHYNLWVESDKGSLSLRNLVEDILEAAKLDSDAIDESDPEFIPYIMTMIENWMKKNNN
jgi:hypothetical protein